MSPVQVKINDRGIAALAYNVLLREGVTLGLGGSFDTQKLDQATHKVRLRSLNLYLSCRALLLTSISSSVPASPSRVKQLDCQSSNPLLAMLGPHLQKTVALARNCCTVLELLHSGGSLRM